MFRGLAQKYAIPGWILLVFYVAIETLDWWQRIDFVSGKIMQINPLLSSIFDFVVSGQGRLIVLVAGIVLIILAATRRSFESVSSTYPAPRWLEPIAATPPTDANHSERIFVDATPEYLMGLFEGHTDIQGQRLATAYIGKWLRVSGKLHDILSSRPTSALVTFEHKPHKLTDLYMYFDGTNSVERISTIRPGTAIAVIGKINRINRITVELQNCELV